MVIYWNTLKHYTGGKSTSILCRPSGSHHRHPQQHSRGTLPKLLLSSPSTPPPPAVRFCSCFLFAFSELEHTFQSPFWAPLPCAAVPVAAQSTAGQAAPQPAPRHRHRTFHAWFAISFLPFPRFCQKAPWPFQSICRGTSATVNALVWQTATASSIFLTGYSNATSTFTISLQHRLGNIRCLINSKHTNTRISTELSPATLNNNFKKSCRENELTSLHLVRIMKAKLISVDNESQIDQRVFIVCCVSDKGKPSYRYGMVLFLSHMIFSVTKK